MSGPSAFRRLATRDRAEPSPKPGAPGDAPRGEVLPALTPSAAAGPDRVTERSELRERLNWALGTLNEVQREIVLLHDLEGWKHSEIAERLDMPSGTVRSHLHYARRRLRECLTPGGTVRSQERVG